MNYFSLLLVAAGLPISMGPTVPTVVTAPLAVSTTDTIAGIATVSQAYQTIQQVDVMALSSSAGTPSSAMSGPAASSGSSVEQTPTTTNANSAATLAADATEMINLINQARMQAGLTPYTVNETLMTLAQERALALAAGPFTSDLAQYGWPIQMEEAAGIEAQGMGAENIAEAASVSQAFSLLMASPAHKANILNPDETQIGVGVAPWGTGVAISELFIGPDM